jgi:23S rRNA (uracil1939-C5)-methyltransferase
VVGVVHNVNPTQGNVLFGATDLPLAGATTIEDTIGPVRVTLGPRSFFQLNRDVAALAYAELRAAAAAVAPLGHVVDAYAGVGGIAATLAPLAAETIAIESNAAATRAAAEPGHAVRFITGDVAHHLAEIPSADLLVLNPPRAGCAPAVLDEAARLRPRLIGYLSCNPTTLARDLDRLARSGLHAAVIQPYDMLPHTSHVEALAIVERTPLR